jgi:hypothetical protein
MNASSPDHRRTTAVAVALVVLLQGLTGQDAASACEVRVPDPPNEPGGTNCGGHVPEVAPASLMLPTSGGQPSPNGCFGDSKDHPHQSRHNPANMNVISYTKCTWASDIYVHAQIWESRWWGWDRIGPHGEFGFVIKTEIWTNSAAPCKNNWVRGTGYHQERFGGKTYVAWTESPHINNPCNL